MACLRADSLLSQRTFWLSGDSPLTKRDYCFPGPAFLKPSIWYAENNGLSAGLDLKYNKKEGVSFYLLAWAGGIIFPQRFKMCLFPTYGGLVHF